MAAKKTVAKDTDTFYISGMNLEDDFIYGSSAESLLEALGSDFIYENEDSFSVYKVTKVADFITEEKTIISFKKVS